MKPIVLHIVNDLSMGGISSVLYQLVKNHKESKYQYLIFNLSGSGDSVVIKQFNELNIQIYNTHYFFTEGYSLINQYKKAYFTKSCFTKNTFVFNLIKDVAPSIIHTHVLPFELYVLKKALQKLNCLFIHTDHLVRINESEIKQISKVFISFPFKKFYKNIHVIAVSEAVKNYLIKFGINEGLKSLQVITNKLPQHFKRIEYKIKSEYKVVYVARISEVKGHRDLINAWARLPKLNLHLYIIGPDELNGRIQKLAEEGKQNNKITFTGGINNVFEFIKDADIGIFPSYKEGLPMALLEKMQLGIPCVVSDIEELKSVITNGKDGLLYKCSDIIELAEKIIMLASDIKLRESLGKEAALTIAELYVSKLGGINFEYEDVYSKLLLK